MNKHRQRGPGRRGGQRMAGGMTRLADFPVGSGKRIENMQSRNSQVEYPSMQGIIENILNTASQVIDVLRPTPLKHGELPRTDRKPLSYPLIDPALCTGCGICADSCPNDAISVNATASVDESLCTRCRKCFDVCPRGAITFVEEGLEIHGR